MSDRCNICQTDVDNIIEHHVQEHSGHWGTDPNEWRQPGNGDAGSDD